jgi:uncharacterized protein YggU (UPF0235/DUF167 family)
MSAVIDQMIQVKVSPRAREASLTQMPDGTWVAKLKSPPVDGKANAELIVLIAKHFKCRKSAVIDQGRSVGPHEAGSDLRWLTFPLNP